ncbi:hypothetical protein PMAYCL1PPCAC_14563, partial [Pristionchus mayeri]
DSDDIQSKRTKSPKTTIYPSEILQRNSTGYFCRLCRKYYKRMEGFQFHLTKAQGGMCAKLLVNLRNYKATLGHPHK